MPVANTVLVNIKAERKKHLLSYQYLPSLCLLSLCLLSLCLSLTFSFFIKLFVIIFLSFSLTPSNPSWNFSSFKFLTTDSISLEFFSDLTIYFVVYSLSLIGSKANCISLLLLSVINANLNYELRNWSFLIAFISML